MASADDELIYTPYTAVRVFAGSLAQTAIIYPAAHLFGILLLSLLGAFSGRHLGLSAYLCILVAFLFASLLAGYLFPRLAFWRGLASFMWFTAFDAMAAKVFEQPSIYPWQTVDVMLVCLGSAFGMILSAICCGIGGWARQHLPAWMREELIEFYESIGLKPPFAALAPEEAAELKERLAALAGEDGRQPETGDGFLVTTYALEPPNDEMRRNAEELLALVHRFGWPGRRLVGDAGANMAWVVLQRYINIPHLQLAMLPYLIEAAGQRDIPAWQPAALEDRIRILEGRPQLYGTHLMPDAEGRLVPWPIEAPESVDKRRHMLGMEPLAKSMAQAQLSQSPLPSSSLAEWRKRWEEWAPAVGWHIARSQ